MFNSPRHKKLFCFLFLIFGVISPYATATTLKLNLSFSEGEKKLVRLQQNGIDAQITLFDESTGKQVKKISFPWHKGLPEYMYFDSHDCARCRLVLHSDNTADTKQLEYDISNLVDLDSIPFWRGLNVAGSLALKSKHQRGNSKSATLRTLIEVLRTALENSPSLELSWHIQTLLAEACSLLGDVDQQKDVLAAILESTSAHTGQLYRIHALYEMAAYEKNQVVLSEMYEEALRLCKSPEVIKESARLYATGANYKAVNHVRNAEFQEAFSLLNNAINLFEEGRNWRDMMYPLHNLSWAQQRAGNMAKSLEYAVQQRLLAERFHFADHQVLSLYNLAMAYGKLGELGKAEQFLDKAIAKFEARPSDSGLSTVMGGYLLEERARRLLEQGAYAEASDIASQSKNYFKQAAYPDRVIDALYLEGQIEFARSNMDIARKKFLQVIKYDRINKRQRDLGVHLLRLADLEIRSKRFTIASDYQVEALRILQTTDDVPKLVAAVVQAAQLIINLGDFKTAKQLLEDIAPGVEMFGRPVDQARRHYTYALASMRLNQNKEAIAHAQNARQIVEHALDNIVRQDLKRLFLALHRSVIDLNIELMALNYPDDPLRSLVLAESVKARTLKASLSEIYNQSGVRTKISTERELLLDEIQTQAIRWHGGQGDSTALLKKTRSLGQQLYRIEAMGLLDKTKGDTTSREHSSTDLREATVGELLGVYFLGERRSWLWLRTASNTELHVLPSAEEIYALIAEYRETIDIPPSRRAFQDAWTQRDAINALSEVIVSPLQAKLLSGEIENLTLLPDGIMHGMPFAPLLILKDQSSLLEKVVLRVDASLSNHLVPNRDKEVIKRINTVLVIAGANPSVEIQTDKLDGSMAEAKAIQSKYQQAATILSGESATKGTLFNHDLEKYDVIHFATHGMINMEESLLSGLALTPDAHGTLLLVPEISSLPVSNKLVVLSSCDSSLGKLVFGEGALSLTRAFMEAGASHIIGSLWPVQDDASASLMSLFYHFLHEGGRTPESALREAQLKLSREYEGRWSDPYYWSGFQVYRARI